MEQGSKDWLEWRRQGLGGSDAPIVMGVSPWKTRFQLWEEKLGLSESEPMNQGQSLGHLWEPRIREMAENESGLRFKPDIVVHPKKPYLRASLDGVSRYNILLECKYASKKDHQLAESGLVPDKYIPQMQHQMLVTGSDLVYYASFNEALSTFYLVEYKRDEDYIKNLEAELDAFWNLVITKTPPEPSNKDFKVILDKELNKLADQYKKITDQIKDLSAQKDEIKQTIISRLDREAVILGEIKAQKVYKKGSIDYDKIEALKGVDLEQYRKSPVSYWVFK